MEPRKQTQHILIALKGLMKKKGYKYRDLAEGIGASLPTVKRMFIGEDLSLQRLTSICDFLGFSLHEFIELTKVSDSEQFHFTVEQENFFATNPPYLAFLYVLQRGDLSVEEIQKKYSLSQKSIQKYFRQLEKLGLIRVSPENRVRVLVRGVISWDDRGILGKTFSTRMIRQLAERGISTDSKHLFMILNGWSLTGENYDEMKKDFTELPAK